MKSGEFCDESSKLREFSRALSEAFCALVEKAQRAEAQHPLRGAALTRSSLYSVFTSAQRVLSADSGEIDQVNRNNSSASLIARVKQLLKRPFGKASMPRIDEF